MMTTTFLGANCGGRHGVPRITSCCLGDNGVCARGTNQRAVAASGDWCHCSTHRGVGCDVATECAHDDLRRLDTESFLITLQGNGKTVYTNEDASHPL